MRSSVKPSSSRQAGLWKLLVCAALCGVAGCQSLKQVIIKDDQIDAATTRPATTQTSSQRPLPVLLQPEQRPVVQGPLPLMYLVEFDTTLRVVDQSTGQIVASTAAPSRSILRVAATGVYLGTQQLAAGPLQSRSYAIELVVSDQNTIRQTHIGPASTQPAVPGQ
jgi:hypothetical protein